MGRVRLTVQILPSVISVRWALRRSDDLEAVVHRLVQRAAGARPLRRWCGPRGTDGSVRGAIRLLGAAADDGIVGALSVYVVATRQRWPARFVSGVAVLEGHVCDCAWVEIDGRVFGSVAAVAGVRFRERFREENPFTRQASAGPRPERSSIESGRAGAPSAVTVA